MIGECLHHALSLVVSEVALLNFKEVLGGNILRGMSSSGSKPCLTIILFLWCISSDEIWLRIVISSCLDLWHIEIFKDTRLVWNSLL